MTPAKHAWSIFLVALILVFIKERWSSAPFVGLAWMVGESFTLAFPGLLVMLIGWFMKLAKKPNWPRVIYVAWALFGIIGGLMLIGQMIN